eukprot:m.6499 g.6499  ORF g.6499 m.6499 type:complete len:84 (-) comp8531_c0_seq1:24-275(-)
MAKVKDVSFQTTSSMTEDGLFFAQGTMKDASICDVEKRQTFQIAQDADPSQACSHPLVYKACTDRYNLWLTNREGQHGMTLQI